MTDGEVEKHIFKPTRCLHCERRLRIVIRVLGPGSFGAEMRICTNTKCRRGTKPEKLEPEWVLKDSVPAVELQRPTKEEIRNNTTWPST